MSWRSDATLDLNGCRFAFLPIDAVTAGTLDETRLAAWFRVRLREGGAE
jgi:hypothetical protein